MSSEYFIEAHVMDINKLSFVARKRTPWEVFDFCQLMVKSHFLSMFKIAALLYIPIALLSWQLFSITSAGYIIWWLKPLLERPLLDYLAKQSFAQPTTAWQCIKSIKNLRLVDIFAMLTYRRFSPNRAYLAPVEQLEKLQGNAGKKRKSILLNRNNHKQSFWIIFCVHIEMLLVFLFMAISYSFIPQGIDIDLQLDNLNAMIEGIEYLYFIAYLLAITLIAPYFVTGGFLMYLNSRINLEAWDIELAFKKIASKTAQLVGVVVFALATNLMLPAADVYAQNSITKTLENTLDEASIVKPLSAQTQLQQADNLYKQQQVDDIYQEHQLIDKMTSWQPVNNNEDEVDLKWLRDFFASLSGISNFIGYLFWFLIALLVLWLGKVIYQSGVFSRLTGIKMKAKSKTKLQTTELPSFIRDVEHQQWPEDLLSAAQQALTEQEFRQALMLVLKFSLNFAQQQSDVSIYAHMTETECERALLKSLPEQWHSSYQQLFMLWIKLAWAHRSVSSEQVHDLIKQFQAIEQTKAAA